MFYVQQCVAISLAVGRHSSADRSQQTCFIWISGINY